MKSNLNFTPSDKEFKKVLHECWQTFNHSNFSKEYDRIGIVIGRKIQKVKDHLEKLLEWARKSENYLEFKQKVYLPNLSTNEMRWYYQIFHEILTIDEDEKYFSFLKVLTIVHLDLIRKDTSRDYVDTLDNLKLILKEQIPPSFFSQLESLSSEYKQSSGTINHSKILHIPSIFQYLRPELTIGKWKEKWETKFRGFGC